MTREEVMKIQRAWELALSGRSFSDSILIARHGFDPTTKEQRQPEEGEAWRPTEDELMEHVLEEERICGRSR